MQYLRARYYSPETGRFIQKDEYKGDFAKPETLNRYAYCSGNPVNRNDPSGNSWFSDAADWVEGAVDAASDLLGKVSCSISDNGKNTNAIESKAIINIDWSWPGVLALGTTAVIADGPLPFGDIVAIGAILAYGVYTLVDSGVLTFPTTQQGEATNILDRADEKVGDIAEVTTDTKTKEKEPTIIYRWGSRSNRNLTPRAQDVSGISFSTVMPLSGQYVTTTIQTINSTGVLVAIQDGPTHVSVRPVSIFLMQEWIASRDNAETNPHPLTVLLKSLVY